MGDISRVEFYGNMLNLKDTEARNLSSEGLSNIWKVIGNIQELQAFAIYSEDDHSLSFYCDIETPSSGDIYRKKTVTNIYTGLESTGTTSNPPWYSNRTNVWEVYVDPSFYVCQPTSCYYWFYGFSNCKKMDGIGNIDTSQVTTLYGMFYSVSSADTIDVSRWDTSNVTTMQYLFRGCTSVKELDVSNWNTSKVTSMYYMFYNCNQLTELDVHNFDTSSVTDMRYMFSTCSSITTIYSDDNNFVTSAISSSSNGNYMFTSCTNLVGGNGTVFNSSNTNYTYAHVDVDGNPGYFTQK